MSCRLAGGDKMEVATITEVLGGVEVLQKKIHNKMDLVELSNKGVTKDALLRLGKYLNLSISQMADLIAITERTIQRYTLNKTFNHIVSEQILQIAEVAVKGTNTFGDKDKFLSWMRQPNKALANKTPMNLLRSRFGTDMILDELGRLEYGVFS
jgi:putative toxin-antitoxin system antitoxin component (TIGR02293 family)